MSAMKWLASSLLVLLCISAWSLRSACSNQESSPNCALFTRRSDGAIFLDCRRKAVICCYVEEEFSSSMRTFVGIRRDDSLVHWELSPPLLGNQTINYLPAEAFQDFNERLDPSVVLVLRQLYQDSLSLIALSNLSSLRHLSLRESNITCLPAGTFTGFGSHLESLSLLDNPGLACLQPGAFDGLHQLRSLRISGSPLLLHLDSDAFCGLLRVAELSLRLPIDATVPWAALSHLPDSLSGLHLARGSQLADYMAAQELLPSLAGFICSRSASLKLNGFPVDGLVTEQLDTPMHEFCAEFHAPSTAASRVLRHSNITNSCDFERLLGCSTDCHSEWSTSSLPSRKGGSSSSPVTPSSPVAGSSGNSPRRDSRDRPNLVGTVLLTACAFMAGVMTSMYCFLYRRRMHRLKSVKNTAASTPTMYNVRRGIRAPPMVSDDEPVRLVGFRSLSDEDSESHHQLFIVCSASLTATPCIESY